MLVLAVTLTGCPDNGRETDPPGIGWEAAATGDPTTAVNLTFDRAVAGLTAGDITVTPAGRVTAGALTGSGTEWTLEVTGVTQTGPVNLTVARPGVDAGERTVTLLAVEGWDAAAYGEPTTAVNLIFGRAVDGLTLDEITITGANGVTLGELTGSGTSWSLAVPGVAETVSVGITVARPNVDGGERQATLTAGQLSFSPVAGGHSVTGRGTVTGPIIVILALHNGEPVVDVGNHAFMNNQLTEVTIPAGVTSIGISAFDGNQLTEVTIPVGVTSIGTAVFRGNLLTEVTIPADVTSIGQLAFSGNLLTELTIPAGVTSIGDSAFFANPLITVTIPFASVALADEAWGGNSEWRAGMPGTVNWVFAP